MIIRENNSILKALLAIAFFIYSSIGHANGTIGDNSASEFVPSVVEPLMQAWNIPGMSVAVIADGESRVFNFGVASRETKRPVTDDTLFEIGSIARTFTATLAAYAELEGKLSLSDSVSDHLPALKGGSFENVTLLNLATHTSGLALHVPVGIATIAELADYCRDWEPPYAAGMYRRRSDLGVGLLGIVAAKAAESSYAAAAEKRLFHPLGMNRTYADVPKRRWIDYAQGYTSSDLPTRMRAGLLASPSDGVKSRATDLARFLQANMEMLEIDEMVQRAITNTHTSYFKAGDVTQGLVWEQYPYPVTLERLLAGNSASMMIGSVPATRLKPPFPPRRTVLINKVGSTEGFSAYVAYVPSKEIGVVLLANKSFPIAERVQAGYRIIEKLGQLSP